MAKGLVVIQVNGRLSSFCFRETWFHHEAPSTQNHWVNNSRPGRPSCIYHKCKVAPCGRFFKMYRFRQTHWSYKHLFFFLLMGYDGMNLIYLVLSSPKFVRTELVELLHPGFRSASQPAMMRASSHCRRQWPKGGRTVLWFTPWMRGVRWFTCLISWPNKWWMESYMIHIDS